jgi:tellurite resistance protein
MADKPWIFDRVRRGSEEAYHQKKEKEALEQLRGRVERERTRRYLDEELDVHDERVLKALEDLGFTREVLILLHIVPLIEVAWSDGRMNPEERKKILELAATRNIVPGTLAYERLLPLLETKPADEAFAACTRVIRAMFPTLPEEDRRGIEENLPAYASAVAHASGGVLGLGKVSREERAVLEKIAREIGDAHRDAVKAVTSNIGKA